MAAQPPKAGQGASFFKSKRIGQARIREIEIVDKFDKGYRNREDITNLPPGVLVVGSQNVLVNTASRVQIRQGYALDGASSSVNAPILSSFEWLSKYNGKRYVRFGFLTSAGGNGQLQYRHSDATGGVLWSSIATGISNPGMNFTSFWLGSISTSGVVSGEQIRVMLYVNGDGNVNEWSGAYDFASSVGSSSVTMANPVNTTGWYVNTAAKQKFLGNGTLFAYTGSSGNTFTGVTPNPTGTVASGDTLVQAVYSSLATGFTSGPPASYKLDLISTLLNQVFLGSLTSPTFYMSKTNDYTNYSQSSPRIPSDGSFATLDDNLVAFIPQEDVMYMSAGKDHWYNTKLTQSSTYNGTSATALITETFEVKPLKTNNLQGAQSQALVNNKGNEVIMVQSEPAFELLGRLENIFGTPQTSNLSDPIKNDFDSYDFTGGSVYSWRRYLLCTVPTLGITRIFNQTTKAWEAPQTLPITSFYTVGSDLYGHSSLTSESYRLFTGYADRQISGIGSPIPAIANFSYQNYGTRTVQKNANEFYMEGYIDANTTLIGELNNDLDGCEVIQVFEVDGSDKTVVCIPTDESSFGKESLGKEKFGGDKAASITGLPPKFRVIKTFNRTNFYEQQFSFSISGVNQRFELLAFGTNAGPASDTQAPIKQ